MDAISWRRHWKPECSFKTNLSTAILVNPSNKTSESSRWDSTFAARGISSRRWVSSGPWRGRFGGSSQACKVKSATPNAVCRPEPRSGRADGRRSRSEARHTSGVHPQPSPPGPRTPVPRGRNRAPEAESDACNGTKPHVFHFVCCVISSLEPPCRLKQSKSLPPSPHRS